MTVYDFLDYCCDEGLLTVEIYSLEAGKILWTGDGDEVPAKYGFAELGSFDVPTKADTITLNID